MRPFRGQRRRDGPSFDDAKRIMEQTMRSGATGASLGLARAMGASNRQVGTYVFPFYHSLEITSFF
jgi:hypothetical protein